MSYSHLLTREVTYQEPAALAGDGSTSLTYSVQATTPARVEETNRTFYDSEGKHRETTHVFVATIRIKERSLVWIPGASTASKEEALIVVRRRIAQTPGGLPLYEYYLGL